MTNLQTNNCSNQNSDIMQSSISPKLKRIKKIISMNGIPSKGKVLNIGTGNGETIPYLLQSAPQRMVSIDISAKTNRITKKNLNDQRVEYITTDFFTFEEDRFDYIMAYNTFFYYNDKAAFAEKVYQLLNTNGRFALIFSDQRVLSKSSRYENGDWEYREKREHACKDIRHFEDSFEIELVADIPDCYIISGRRI